MKSVDKILQDLALFSGMISSGCRLSSWCFNMQKKLFYTTCPNEKEFLMFLNDNECLDYALNPDRDFSRTLYISNTIGLVWVVDYVYYDTDPFLATMLGPVFLSESSLRGIEEALSRQNYSVQVKNSLLQILRKVPAVPMATLQQYARMLHYVIAEDMDYHEEYQFRDNFGAVDEKYQLTEKLFPQQSSQERERMAEERLLRAIREGNYNYEKIVNEEHSFFTYDSYKSKNKDRDIKNSILIFIALCSRAAVEGGVSARTAKMLEIQYISKVEQAETVTELVNIHKEMIRDFILRVREIKNNPGISNAIRECCDYVQENLSKPLELRDIAKHVGYTEYYLSKKFHKEMGVKLSEYIMNARIDLAKIWLISTQKSIQDISDEMNFSSRTYFSKVFKEKIGETPAAYREKAKVQSGKDLKG